MSLMTASIIALLLLAGALCRQTVLRGMAFAAAAAHGLSWLVQGGDLGLPVAWWAGIDMAMVVWLTIHARTSAHWRPLIAVAFVYIVMLSLHLVSVSILYVPAQQYIMFLNALTVVVALLLGGNGLAERLGARTLGASRMARRSGRSV